MITYKITNLKADANQKVVVVDFNVSNGTDNISASEKLTGEVTIPFADLTEEIVIEWVKALPIAQFMESQLQVVSVELPWAPIPEEEPIENPTEAE